MRSMRREKRSHPREKETEWRVGELGESVPVNEPESLKIFAQQNNSQAEHQETFN